METYKVLALCEILRAPETHSFRSIRCELVRVVSFCCVSPRPGSRLKNASGASINFSHVPDGKKIIEEKSKTVWTALVGKLYPQALLGKVVEYLTEYRGKS